MEKARLLDHITKHRRVVEEAARINPMSFKAWILLLDAEVADVIGNRYHGESSSNHEFIVSRGSFYNTVVKNLTISSR
jgi:hypothetical protein